MKNSLIIAFLLGFLIFTSGCCALPYILKNNSSLNNLTDSVNNTTNIDNSSVQIETTEINGTITDSNAFVLSGASVSLIGNESNYSAVTDSNGNYEITNVQKGIYTIITTKSGFSDDTYTLFLGAGSHTYNPSLTNLCNDYYLINATSNYIITTGYMGTLEQGSVTFTLPYPDHSYYDISPAVDGTASSTSIQQIGSNRMLTWTLKDNDGNTVPFHIYVTYQGKQTEEVFSNRNMDIKESGIEQPNYFGSVTESVSGKV